MDINFEDSLGQPFDTEFVEEEHIYSLDEMINVVKVAFKITIQTTDFSNIVQQQSFTEEHLKYIASSIRNAEYPPAGTTHDSSAMQTEYVHLNESFLGCDVQIYKHTKETLLHVLNKYYQNHQVKTGLIRCYSIEFTKLRLINLNATCPFTILITDNQLYYSMKKLQSEMAGYQFDGLQKGCPSDTYVIHYILSTRTSASKQKRRQPNITINDTQMSVKGGLPLKKLIYLYERIQDIVQECKLNGIK